MPKELKKLPEKSNKNSNNKKLEVKKHEIKSAINYDSDHEIIASSSIAWGMLSLVLFSLIFAFWAVFVPIQSASIAEGTIILDLNRKTIQHLEGGIIDNILVKEGQLVKEGDILLYLHDIKAKSDQETAKKRLLSMQVQQARLLAQKDDKKTLDLNEFITEINQFPAEERQELMLALNNQMHLFNTRNSSLAGELKALRDKLTSVKAQKISSQRKLVILRKELKMIKPLDKENNLPITRQYDLEKQITEFEGSVSQLQAEEKVAMSQIGNYKNGDLSKVLDELKEVEAEIVNLSNLLNNAKDVLSRSEIIAPVSGKIMNIKYHTIGAVVPPGGEIMNIIPQNEDLIIEAKIKPQDIDEVRAGLKAKVSLTAYKGKKVPKLDGVILDVSGDIVVNEQTKESYFLARVRIVDENIEKLKHRIELYPGMPAQVFILTGSRTLLSYLFTPIQDAAYKAFREE